MRHPLLRVVALFALLTPVAAQEVRCLLAEGDTLSGLPGHTVSSLSNTAVNQLGGYAVSLSSSDGGTTLSSVWGAASFGDAPAPLWTESTFGVYEQTTFESFFGIDDSGTPAYGPTCTDTTTATTGLDCVWYGATPVAVEGLAIPTLPGNVWRYNSRPGVTRDGQPFWAGGINDAVTGTNEGEGLFFGLGATPLYKSGDIPPGAPAAVEVDGITFDFRFSAYGTHHITSLELELSSSTDTIVVVDGATLLVGGAIVQEGTAFPAAAGGLAGELWGSFDAFGINEAGDFMIAGNTNGGSTATNEFVLVNGAVVHREGDVLDGEVLTGAMEGAAMNENGELAFLWDVVDGTGSLEALYVAGELVLKEGDPVDVDGDGVPEPSTTVTNFTGIDALTVGPNRVAYFTADVDLFGTSTTSDDVECFFAAATSGAPDFLASPARLSVADGGSQAMFLDAGAANAGALYLVSGSVSGTVPGIPFGGFSIPLNPDFYLFLTLNKPNVAPLVNTLSNLDGEGLALAQWQLPAGAFPSLAGVTASHAYVLIDGGTLLPTYVSGTTSLTFVP